LIRAAPNIPQAHHGLRDIAGVLNACAGCGHLLLCCGLPALKGTALSADAIADVVTKGKGGAKAPHTKGVADLSADQAKAIADFVKGLK